MVYIRGESMLQTTFDSVAKDPRGEALLLVNGVPRTWDVESCCLGFLLRLWYISSHTRTLVSYGVLLMSCAPRVLSTLSIFREG